MSKHHWTAIVFAVAGVFAAGFATAGPTASQLNRMFSSCQTGDYSACSAYNRAIFEVYQARQQVQMIQPATIGTLDPVGTVERQPAPNRTIEVPALAQTNP